MEGPSDNPAVLVVDDDLDILAALHDLLEHQGYRVTCASTCRDALAQVMGFRYHAVLLDIGLPDGDGLSVLDLLRKQHPLLPVIILTIFGSLNYRLPREIPLTWGIFVCEQTLRSGCASRTAPAGHSSQHLRWTSTTHHPSVSLARLLSLFLSALPMNECRPPPITTAEQKVVRTSDYREDLDPENVRLKTVRRPK